VKLLHLANHHSTNVGNGALIRGTERILRADLGAIEFVPEPWDDYTLTGLRRFDDSFVDRVNATDGLLVGGAVTLNGRPMFKQAGMRLDLPLHLWSRIERPIVFYGISYRVWPGQRYRNLDALRRTIRYLVEQPNVLFGVRNDGTKVWLEGLLGFSSARIFEVPDPALYVPAAAEPRPELAPGRRHLILALNNEDEIYRFGGRLRERAWPALSALLEERRLARWWGRVPGWRSAKRRILREIAAALDAISTRGDLGIVLCPHYFDDYAIMAEFVELCSPRLAHQVMTSAGLGNVRQTEHFYALYAQADVALSMRVHSMSPAIGLGTPTVALSSQPRLDRFMGDAGLADYSLDVFAEGLAERIRNTVGAVLERPHDARACFAAARERMRKRSAEFNARVATLFRPAVATITAQR
jgi:hypothetical protein